MSSLQVIRVYRHLRKVQTRVFKGDLETLKAACDKTRYEFELHRNETDPQIIEKNLNYAKDVSKILEQNVAQAISNDNSVFKLQIRENLEINDNDSIRKNRTKNKQKV